MNKTTAYLVGVLFGIAGLAGILYITIERPEATATFTSTVVLLFGLVSTYFVTVNGQAKVTDRLEQVERNTNGKNTQLQEERDAARETLARLGYDADGKPLTGSTDVQT